MEQLVKLVSEKAGISESQAETAVNTVVDFLKKQLPAPLDSQVEKALQGDAGGLDTGDVAGQVGKLFGKK